MQRPRHFSMLREFQLADWFTLANAFCGTGAVFAAMRFLQEGVVRDLMIGMALIPLAFIFDALDGRIARWRKVASTLGRELDSLADVLSFGVAPAALGYACGMQGGWDWRSDEHTSELQSLMRISYAVFCLKKKKYDNINPRPPHLTQQHVR